jgi:UDP-3-O-[3-hydroxymyristoyl] glucosamine N-acyltransferase
LRLQDLAEQFGLELRGEPDHRITGVGTLEAATPDQISFLANPSYTPQLKTTQAGAVLLKEKNADRCPVNVLIAADPYLAYARIAALFDPRPGAEPGVHERAVINPGASLGENVSIGANVVIGANSIIGEGCTLMAGVVIGPGCTLGAGCLLYPNVTLTHGVSLGQRVIVHPGAVIGADGFGIAFAKDSETGPGWEKVPQMGGVRIGDDCEIGANSCVDRGAIDDTVLENDVRIDNLVQIGHNVKIGAHTAIAGGSTIAGSARIGRYCLLAGKAGVNGHVTVADRTTIAGGSHVMRNIEEPGTTWSNNIPAQPFQKWQRNLVNLLKLDTLQQRLRKLEKSYSQENSRKSEKK